MEPKPSYPIPLVDGEPRNERRKGEVDADHILLLQKYSHPKSGTLHKLRRYQGFIKWKKKKEEKKSVAIGMFPVSQLWDEITF